MMRRILTRWLLVPAILFLGAGLVKGGADLSRDWAALVLGVPLALLLVQFFQPTDLGWRLAFGSFCLLILTTAILDLTAAVPRGLPPVSAKATMVALFALQFGIPAWLIWLAKPQGRNPRKGTWSWSASQAEADPNSTGNEGEGDVPPNHPLQPPAGDTLGMIPTAAFARRG